jgi:phosphate:Na+ symporter
MADAIVEALLYGRTAAVASIVVQTLGGLGLFLLGMIIMTDSLRTLAGDAMRKLLLRFTHTPLSGAVTGTVATLIMQSSSATTVAAVGMVGAGLMGFTEALGIIFGANIGTTIKGWLFVMLGFKFKIGELLLPLILVGALLRLFVRGRWSSIGMSIAGFGLIFVGIYLMQQGMETVQQLVTPANFPADTVLGRVQLLLMGMLFSAITQSSSAGVAISLTALHAGAINLPQAAALVVGMDVGTTVTAALATIGGTVGSRRTGLSHVIYNFFTGAGALLLITPYVMLWQWLAPEMLINNAEIVLIAFHTSFNTLGVIIVLPLTYRFARMIEWLIPETAPVYTRALDRNLLKQPPLAIAAARSALNAESIALLQHVLFELGDRGNGRYSNLVELKNDLFKTHAYIDAIEPGEAASKTHEQLVSLFHTMDHVQRLFDRCYEDARRANIAANMQELKDDREKVMAILVQIVNDLEQAQPLDAAERSGVLVADVSGRVDTLRNQVMVSVAHSEISADEGTRRLEAIRWLDRVSEHVSRLTHHLATVMANGSS